MTRYISGALADPGDLLEYFLSIVPGGADVCHGFQMVHYFFLCVPSRTEVDTVGGTGDSDIDYQ